MTRNKSELVELHAQLFTKVDEYAIEVPQCLWS
jgi:hypothetical protein